MFERCREGIRGNYIYFKEDSLKVSRSASSRGSFYKNTKSSRSSSGRSNTSIKDQGTIEKMKVAELLAEQKYIKRRKAAEFENSAEGGESNSSCQDA